MSDAQTIDRLSAATRPAGRVAGFHRWSNLLFVHWRLPAQLVAPLLPRELALDTWEGDAWVGLVPFHMSGVRPWWSPAVPGVSTFCETNVRTYVHDRGRDPGVWFFSLDASSRLAVAVARRRWHLPYFHSRMSLTRAGSRVSYAACRSCRASDAPGCRIEIEPGEALSAAGASVPGRALPGTLEHFLIERYILYAQPAPGKLLQGRVHHAPYPLRRARLLAADESLLAAAGMPPRDPPCHVLFSEGVQVEVFSLRPVAVPAAEVDAPALAHRAAAEPATLP